MSNSAQGSIRTHYDTMENLFSRLGFRWEDLPINEMIDVSAKGVRVMSFDTISNEKTPALVEAIIRKDDQSEYQIFAYDAMIFRGAGTHLIYNNETSDYITLQSVVDAGGALVGLDDYGNSIPLRVVATGNTIPVIDIQVENGCYFTGGVLSHNTGGNALKFYASVRLDVRRVETLKDGDEAYANKTKVKIVKNKCAPPFKVVEFDIHFGKGIDRFGGFVDMGVAHELVKKAGTWYSYKEERIGQGRDNAIQYLKDHPEMAAEIESALRTKLLPNAKASA